MVNNIFKITAMGLLISMGGIVPESHAQFEMSGASEKTQINSIPFVVALRKIVPIDYDFSFETEQDLGEIVSYEYFANWTDTLSALLKGMDLSYKISGDIVYIGAVDVKDLPVVVKTEEASEEIVVAAVEEPILTKTEVVEIKQLPIVVEAEAYIWKVKKGFTLQETMKSWGEQAGWNVIWNSDRDYDIQSEASFSGSFVDASSDLIKAFAEADPPVVGTFYKNNTLVIETTSNGEVN